MLTIITNRDYHQHHYNTLYIIIQFTTDSLTVLVRSDLLYLSFFTVCTKKTDIVIIMDEWEPAESSILLNRLATMLQTYNIRIELGLLAQSKTFNKDTGSYNALHIPLGKPDSLLDAISQYTRRICCGSISEMLQDALAMFGARTTRRWFWPTVLLISSKNGYTRENYTMIADTYRQIFDEGIKR